ncbi:uncharacterized protein N7515_001557 [Penicillium bovifimosum]|uniref:Cleavage/polyadenylation specificity factor A subunit N-terminal domain-containing protein n=1 Tax=Penicillium bovifimosum TaxID=126998 RepID=A0A9W9L785_9EURO|nr:uncharacterized protein N7515_001557 [Penicillium bovifimosum]KAJ5142770.1 hypothetical protein N7515_001557 [Penicillium bovifimosum]
MSSGRSPTRSTRIGLLTQTLVTSPVISWILPARIRNRHHNDVVFIGERRIQVKEALASGHLEDVVDKTDIQGSIIGAKVINIGSLLPWEPLAPSRLTVSSPITENLPAQILFLSTSSDELLFMYCSDKGEDPFVSYSRPLPRDVGLAERYGAHIAVDPRSRAVAVCASRGFFGLLWLKSHDDIRMQMAQGKLDPLKFEKFYEVDGDILFMEFLYPKKWTDTRVILLLIVRSNQETRCMIYNWEGEEESLGERPICTSTSLPPSLQFPNMVIPLAKESAYLIVGTKGMTLHTPSGESPPMRYPPILPDGGDSLQAGLWTRWARPSRNWMYMQRYDGIFLCQENGWIYYLEFGNDNELETQTSLGQLPCAVDTAFDILDMGHEGGDYIIAAGSQGDGGLFVQEARDHPRCVQRFVNWAPVPDAVIIPASSPTVGDRTPADAQDRLFVCSPSASEKGAITELRRGVEALVGVSAEMGGFDSIYDMWAVTSSSDDSIHLMVSDPLSSYLLHTTLDMRDGISALEDGTGVENEETLATGCTPSGVIVQVTGHGVQLFTPGDPSHANSIKNGPLKTVTAAFVDGLNSTVVMTSRSQGLYYLHIHRIVTTPSGPSLSEDEASHPLHAEPICITYHWCDQFEFIFIGTGDGTVLSFELSSHIGGLRQHTDTAVSDLQSAIDSRAIDSLAVIDAVWEDRVQKFLLCGLRCGVLVSFKIDGLVANFGDIPVLSIDDLQQQKPRDIGITSIKIKSYGSYALFTCGDKLWHVTYDHDNVSEYVLSRVWITDQSRPTWFPTHISGFDAALAVDSEADEATGVYLFCFADGHLLICSLDLQAKTVPRRIDIPGNPTKITYSSHLQRLIVSYTVTHPSQRLFEFARTARIEFVDPDTKQPVAPYDQAMVADGLQQWRPNGCSGEKVTCIIDWMPKKNGHRYHFIAIGTSIALPPQPNRHHGRLMLIQTTRNPNDAEAIYCQDKHIQHFDDPIYAMVPFNDCVIVAVGKRFVPVSPSGSDLKWSRTITAMLPSPAVAMTVHDNLIYVTTSKESLHIYQIVSHSRLDIVIVDSHPTPLLGLTHCHVDAFEGHPETLLVSSRGGTTRAFAQNNESLYASVPCATADLPVSLVKIARSSRRLPWLETTNIFYGFGIDGSVYRLLTLSFFEWRLLNILLRLCRRDPAICPGADKRRRFADAIYEKTMHVDGNILARLASRESSHLNELLTACGNGQLKQLDSDLVQTFIHATEEALGIDENHVQVVSDWLRDVLGV